MSDNQKFLAGRIEKLMLNIDQETDPFKKHNLKEELKHLKQVASNDVRMSGGFNIGDTFLFDEVEGVKDSGLQLEITKKENISNEPLYTLTYKDFLSVNVSEYGIHTFIGYKTLKQLN
jgi:hypothetical protein